MGGNSRLRSVVLLRASSGTAGRADAGSGDVGDLRGHHWSVARDGRECAGIFGSGVDGLSDERFAASIKVATRCACTLRSASIAAISGVSIIPRRWPLPGKVRLANPVAPAAPVRRTPLSDRDSLRGWTSAGTCSQSART
jgi:hypothetical protein